MVFKWRDEHVPVFLELYKNLECLWNVRSDFYKNRVIRENAYKSICLELNLEGLIPADIQAKIKSIRTVYKTELNKVLKSEKSGAGVDDIYVPMLFWYNQANSFLRGVSTPKESSSNLMESDVHYNMLTFNVEPNGEVTIDDHPIYVGESSGAGLTLPSDEDMPDTGTCLTSTISQSPLLFNSNIDDCNPGSSVMENNTIEEKVKINSESFPQDALNDRTSDNVPKIDDVFKEDTILPSKDTGHTMAVYHKCEESGTHNTENNNHSCNLNYHSVDRDHRCEKCGKCFFNLSTLAEHLIIHSRDSRNECVLCGARFYRSSFLRDHLRIHSGQKDNNQCAECGKCFAQLSILRDHLKLHYGKKALRCVECGKLFSHKCYLRQHVKVHTGVNHNTCVKCGKYFLNIGNLRRHLKRHSKEKNYKCPKCEKYFTYNLYLIKHIKIHSRGKDFKCSECGKCFTHNYSLQQHFNIHTGEKTCKCIDCGECFISSYRLKVHSKIHSVK